MIFIILNYILTHIILLDSYSYFISFKLNSYFCFIDNINASLIYIFRISKLYTSENYIFKFIKYDTRIKKSKVIQEKNR